MIPVVALVGRPNVGKSTLFNCFTKTKDALVADFSGLTRDRQYGQATYQSQSFIVIDTGGLGVEDENIDNLMQNQSLVAIQESDFIFFLVDARAGLTAQDELIASKLRKVGKPLYLVVNKSEGLDEAVHCAEFQSLGFNKLFAISSAHGRGIEPLLSNLFDELKKSQPEEKDAPQDEPLTGSTKIAFVGRPNVGKSTLINRILGEERVVVFDKPGTTRDSIYIPFERNEFSYTLIDTAGVRKRARINEKIEKFSIVKTLQAIKNAHVCMMVIDAKENLTEQDMHLISFIIEAGKALVIAINKWDGLDSEHKEKVRETLLRRLQFANFAKIRFISALHGSGVGLLFQDINEAYASATRKLSTPFLTRLLQDLVNKHMPPSVNGRRIKLRYAHVGGYNPPLIVIHGNQLELLPKHYKQYLINAFIKELNLIGTPVKLEFITSKNPYEGKKNVLTPRQIQKRKRMFKKVKKKY